VAEWSKRLACEPASSVRFPVRIRDSHRVHPLARWHKFVCHVSDDDFDAETDVKLNIIIIITILWSHGIAAECMYQKLQPKSQTAWKQMKVAFCAHDTVLTIVKLSMLFPG